MLPGADFENVKSARMLAPMTALRELMSRDLLAVAPEDTIGEAAQKMVDRGVGSAVVLDFGRLIGIFTERDLMRAVAGRVHPSEARVRGWMTSGPPAVSPGRSGQGAAPAMLHP